MCMHYLCFLISILVSIICSSEFVSNTIIRGSIYVFYLLYNSYSIFAPITSYIYFTQRLTGRGCPMALSPPM